MSKKTMFRTVVVIGLAASAVVGETLEEARKGFKTKLSRVDKHTDPLEEPPASLFEIVKYPTDIGDMVAYLTPKPEGDGKHPAIIWLTGGFPPGGAGSFCWERAPIDDDQSARQYRQAGVVMMYPALRGTFGNPGSQESFLGEADDVLAALNHLKTVPYVDPQRIFLGGHSTGGTLALLVAALSDEFRAVFALGAVARAGEYPPDVLTYDSSDQAENAVRAPIRWLADIDAPTFVIEGETGNIPDLEELKKSNKNKKVRFIQIDKADHFDYLAPINRLIADGIMKSSGRGKFKLRPREVHKAYAAQLTATREANDLRTIASARIDGGALDSTVTARYWLWSPTRAGLEAASKAAAKKGFKPATIEERGQGLESIYILTMDHDITLGDLKAVFEASANAAALAEKHEVNYDGWQVK